MNNDRIQSLLSSSLGHQNDQASYETNNENNNDSKYQEYNHIKDGLLKWNLISYGPGSAIPPPRSGAASVVVKGRLYMFGGYGGGTGRLDDFYSFSFETNTWEKVQVSSREKPGCRENNGVVIGDSSRVYLFGGYNGTAWLNDLWAFDIETKRWECIQESSDPLWDDEHAATIGSTGGNVNNEDDNIMNHHTIRQRAPSRRFGYVSVVHDNKFVLFGGFDGKKWLNDMYEFDFSTKTWKTIIAKGALPSVRSCPAWAKDDTHVYIQGGYDGVERKVDFFACNLNTYTWKEMPCHGGTPPSPRYFHSCCLYGDKMYTYGGYSGSERLADMYVYDFKTGHWSEVNYSNADSCPSGRSSLVAQVYENCLYIFGGYNGVTVLNDFYKFRLVAVSIASPTLKDDLTLLINNSEYSDVTFLVEGNEVHANKAILSVRSEYFKVMLYSGGMRESIMTHDEDGKYKPIVINDVSYEVFLKILHYLYTDTIENISLDIGISLLMASERFMLDRLKSLCEDHLHKQITVSNVIPIYISSYRHNAKALNDIALEFILGNLQDTNIIDGLSDLKMEPDLLVEIIKRKAAMSLSVNNRSNGPFGNGSEWSGTRR